MKEPNIIIENLKAILEECTASEDAVSYVNSEDAGTLKAAIEALEKQEKALEQEFNEWCPDCAEYDKENHCCHRFTKVIRQTVEECKREWANEGWIPVMERLPEDYQHVLVSGEKVVKQGQYIKGMFEMEDGEGYATINSDNIDEPHFYTFKAIAWKPLPAPYTEEDNE